MLRYLHLLLMTMTLLLFSPAHGEMSISVSSSMDSFDYDLDNIHLKLENLSTRWQLSPYGAGDLLVEQLKAKRLIITLKDNDNASAESPLPASIKLPFPISIRQSQIDEVIIDTQGDRQIFHNVKLSFEGNAKTLKLNLSQMATPWGDASAQVNMSATRPFALTGNVALKKSNAEYPYDLDLQLGGNLNTINISSTSWLALQDGKINLLKTDTLKTAAKLLINGQIDLSKDYAFNVESQLLAFHPAALGSFPDALLNTDLKLNGALKPSPHAVLKLTTHDSRWQGKAFSGAIDAVLKDASLQQLAFEIKLATNIITGTGNISTENTHVSWQAELPDLTMLDQSYAGQIKASGTADGAIDNLAIKLDLLAQQLVLSQDFKIEHLTGEADMFTGKDGEIFASLKAEAIKFGSYAPINGNLTVKGTQSDHKISIQAEGKEDQLLSTLQGGLQLSTSTMKKQWLGMLQTLDYSSSTPVKLQAPAAVSADLKQLSLRQAMLALNNGNINIEHLDIAAGNISTKGVLDKIMLSDLPPGLLTLPDSLNSNAVFSGKWTLETQNAINAHFSLWRESGDFIFTKADGTLSPFGLAEMQLTLNVVNNALAAKASVNGNHIGVFNADIATNITKTDSGFSLLKNAPLKLSSNAQLNTLLWLPMPASMMDADLDGKVTLSVTADGTVGQPMLNGLVNGQQVSFSLPSEGIQLNNGVFQARFDNNQLQIEQMRWQGGSGTLTANGWLKLEQGKPEVDLSWKADQFTILSRADRLLTLSGTGNTNIADNLLNISGGFKIDKGLIELAHQDTPTLGDDVVIMGQEAAFIQAPSLQVLLNGLNINLGDSFTLRGRGLDAELTGALTLSGLTEYRPHTEGIISIKKGTFMAYGQILAIERGILNFSGPMDNPGLNIRAMRNSQPVNAGVEISGSALIPVVKLVSIPNLPETDKLSWLVLGHGTEQAGKNDFAILSLAAGALFSQGQSVPLQSQIARAAGLDEFSFAGADAQSASLTLGKRLTSQLYLSYAKSVSSLQDIARLTFNLTPRWALRAEAGNESAVDVLYTFSFK